jgi:hypothetical protein
MAVPFTALIHLLTDRANAATLLRYKHRAHDELTHRLAILLYFPATKLNLMTTNRAIMSTVIIMSRHYQFKWVQ